MSKKWSPEEEAFLKENYAKHSVVYLSRQLGRSRDAIRNKVYALKLGLPKPKDRHPWRHFYIKPRKKA